jgi:hypothetical protein
MEYAKSIGLITEKVHGKIWGRWGFVLFFFFRRTVAIKVVSISGGRIMVDGNSGTTHGFTSEY